ILEYLMNHAYLEPNQLDPNEYDALPIHLLNKRAFPLVKEVLTASRFTTEIDGLQSDDFNEENLLRQLWTLFLSAGPFSNALPGLCQMFMFQMNADYQGNLWLEDVQYLEDPKDRIIQIPLSSVNFTCAHLFTLPVLQVIVIGQGNEVYVYSGMTGTNVGQEP